MFDEFEEGAAGVLYLNPPVRMDETNGKWPFRPAFATGRRSPGKKAATRSAKRKVRLPVAPKPRLGYLKKPESALLKELFT
jgi:hypothetical protein